MARRTTGCPEQIVHMAPRSSVYAPGVMWGKLQQQIQRRKLEWDECTMLTLSSYSSTIAFHHCYYLPINHFL